MLPALEKHLYRYAVATAAIMLMGVSSDEALAHACTSAGAATMTTINPVVAQGANLPVLLGSTYSDQLPLAGGCTVSEILTLYWAPRVPLDPSLFTVPANGESAPVFATPVPGIGVAVNMASAEPSAPYHNLSASRARIGDRLSENVRITVGYQLVLTQKLPAGRYSIPSMVVASIEILRPDGTPASAPVELVVPAQTLEVQATSCVFATSNLSMDLGQLTVDQIETYQQLYTPGTMVDLGSNAWGSPGSGASSIRWNPDCQRAFAVSYSGLAYDSLLWKADGGAKGVAIFLGDYNAVAAPNSPARTIILPGSRHPNPGQLDLGALYVRTGDAIEPGEANALVTINIHYL